jgi:hypothetical protein
MLEEIQCIADALTNLGGNALWGFVLYVVMKFLVGKLGIAIVVVVGLTKVVRLIARACNADDIKKAIARADTDDERESLVKLMERV